MNRSMNKSDEFMNKVVKNRHIETIAMAVKNDPYDALIFGGTAYILATLIVIGFVL